MTECERILKEGVVSESFLEEEIICDFLVNKEMKKNWAICIDLLIKFDEVCRKHNLRYFVAFGSLLGIVRHNGFIPWDDDVDVCMLRNDYEKLLKLRTEFQHPYFLQIPGEDGDYFFSFTKLRNSNTTAVSRTFRYSNFNHGINLDIFPLDNCIQSRLDFNAALIKELNMENSANMRRSNPYKTEKDYERCEKYKASNPLEVLKKIETIAQQYNNQETEWVTCATMTIYKPQRLTFKREDVMNTIKVSFYGHDLYIPKNYDRVLRATYGDYMKFPPIEDRGCWHNNAIFLPDVPYKETIKNLQMQDYHKAI